MKKTVFFIPAMIFAAFYGLAVFAVGFSSVSPIAYVWIALLIISGALLAKGKFWGGLFGLAPGIHLMYMGTRDTGQIFNEMPLGIIVAVFYLLCCGFVYYKKKKTIK